MRPSSLPTASRSCTRARSSRTAPSPNSSNSSHPPRSSTSRSSPPSRRSSSPSSATPATPTPPTTPPPTAPSRQEKNPNDHPRPRRHQRPPQPVTAHILRSPDTIITTAVTPIALMLLFVYVLGGAI